MPLAPPRRSETRAMLRALRRRATMPRTHDCDAAPQTSAKAHEAKGAAEAKSHSTTERVKEARHAASPPRLRPLRGCVSVPRRSAARRSATSRTRAVQQTAARRRSRRGSRSRASRRVADAHTPASLARPLFLVSPRQRRWLTRRRRASRTACTRWARSCTSSTPRRRSEAQPTTLHRRASAASWTQTARQRE